MNKSLSPAIVAVVIVVVLAIVGAVYLLGGGPSNRASRYQGGDPSKMPMPKGGPQGAPAMPAPSTK